MLRQIGSRYLAGINFSGHYQSFGIVVNQLVKVSTGKQLRERKKESEMNKLEGSNPLINNNREIIKDQLIEMFLKARTIKAMDSVSIS